MLTKCNIASESSFFHCLLEHLSLDFTFPLGEVDFVENICVLEHTLLKRN